MKAKTSPPLEISFLCYNWQYKNNNLNTATFYVVVIDNSLPSSYFVQTKIS